MIRKLILPLFLVLAVAMNAQVSFGVHAGLGFTTVTTPKVLKDLDLPYKSKVGGMLGVTSTIEICNFLSFQPELNISWRGYKDKISIPDGLDYTVPFDGELVKVNSIYGELPLMFKLYPFPSYGFNIQAGPQLGVLISRKLGGSVKHPDLLDLVPKDNRDIDFSFNFGAGYSLYHWDLDIRYYVGMVKTFTTLDNCMNRGLQIILGYNF